MNIYGFVLFLVSWLTIIGLTVYCFWRVLRK